MSVSKLHNPHYHILIFIFVDQGNYVTVTITDRCPGCKGRYDLDLSPAAFNKLGNSNSGPGRLEGVQWEFVGGGPARRADHDDESMGDLSEADTVLVAKDVPNTVAGHRMSRRRRMGTASEH